MNDRQPSSNVHGRTHSLLRLQKLLSLRDGASPFTLLVDSLEQPAGELVREFVLRAEQATCSTSILLSFATLRKPAWINGFVLGAGRELSTSSTDLKAVTLQLQPSTTADGGREQRRTVVVIDSLNALASSAPTLAVCSFLAGIVSPTTSLLAVFHADVPVTAAAAEYAPDPGTLLNHLATAVVRVSSLGQELLRDRALNRSAPEPVWGLGERREGVLVGLTADGPPGLVLDVEMRRRSGRCDVCWYVLLPSAGAVGRLALLADYQTPAGAAAAGDGAAEPRPESTFNLDLTEKQRHDRGTVVLPYLDAQTSVGEADGGRILYDIGREDDFDDEEDEI